MKHLAIIPARSGSKGLKDKNIKLLNGKPLMAYTIQAAISSKIFDEVMVSTDSNKYADIALEYGASVPFLRSDELSNDVASSWDVVKDIVSKYSEQGLEFDVVTLLQPTSPLRTKEDIVNSYALFMEKRANIVTSVCETEHSPLWMGTLPSDLSMEKFVNSSLIGKPRQQLETHYRFNGAIYIVKTQYLLESKELYKHKSYAYVMDKEHSVDIDDDIDFALAKILSTVMKK